MTGSRLHDAAPQPTRFPPLNPAPNPATLQIQCLIAVLLRLDAETMDIYQRIWRRWLR